MSNIKFSIGIVANIITKLHKTAMSQIFSVPKGCLMKLAGAGKVFVQTTGYWIVSAKQGDHHRYLNLIGT